MNCGKYLACLGSLAGNTLWGLGYWVLLIALKILLILAVAGILMGFFAL